MKILIKQKKVDETGAPLAMPYPIRHTEKRYEGKLIRKDCVP